MRYDPKSHLKSHLVIHNKPLTLYKKLDGEEYGLKTNKAIV